MLIFETDDEVEVLQEQKWFCRMNKDVLNNKCKNPERSPGWYSLNMQRLITFEPNHESASISLDAFVPASDPAKDEAVVEKTKQMIERDVVLKNLGTLELFDKLNTHENSVSPIKKPKRKNKCIASSLFGRIYYPDILAIKCTKDLDAAASYQRPQEEKSNAEQVMDGAPIEPRVSKNIATISSPGTTLTTGSTKPAASDNGGSIKAVDTPANLPGGAEELVVRKTMSSSDLPSGATEKANHLASSKSVGETGNVASIANERLVPNSEGTSNFPTPMSVNGGAGTKEPASNQEIKMELSESVAARKAYLPGGAEELVVRTPVSSSDLPSGATEKANHLASSKSVGETGNVASIANERVVPNSEGTSNFPTPMSVNGGAGTKEPASNQEIKMELSESAAARKDDSRSQVEVSVPKMTSGPQGIRWDRH